MIYRPFCLSIELTIRRSIRMMEFSFREFVSINLFICVPSMQAKHGRSCVSRPLDQRASYMKMCSCHRTASADNVWLPMGHPFYYRWSLFPAKTNGKYRNPLIDNRVRTTTCKVAFSAVLPRIYRYARTKMMMNRFASLVKYLRGEPQLSVVESP